MLQAGWGCCSWATALKTPDWPNQAMCTWEKLECHTRAPPELQLTPGFCLVRLVTSQGQEWCCYGPPASLRLCDQHYTTAGTCLSKNCLKRVRQSCCIIQGSSSWVPYGPDNALAQDLTPGFLFHEPSQSFLHLVPFLFSFLPQCNCSKTSWAPRRQISV